MTTTAYIPAPDGAPADAPRVFAVVAAVMSDAMPVGKDQKNTQQNYAFRGIDDVMSAMAGPMRKHGLFILPSIAEHKQERDGKMTRTAITMRYRIYGPAGDCLVADVPGEAFDFADKSTNKAQSAALKYLLFTLFMLPVDGRSIDDGDRHHPEPTEQHRAEHGQRQQRRQQRQQQRGGQQRHSGAAEQRTQGPPRDFIAEATQAPTPEALTKAREAAVAAGAPADYLARLDAVAQQKARAVAGNPHRHSAPGQQGASGAGDEHARAEDELRAAAKAAQVPNVDAEFEKSYGLPIAEAATSSVREMTGILRRAAA